MGEKEVYQDQVEGRNAVIELLESGKDINKIFITKGERHGSIHKIISMAKGKKKDGRNGTNRKLPRCHCIGTTL